ncbi:MAG: hypothetical protein LBH26_02635, partial [Treponema sp.]|nr:hypothetical protein [Treponema sp.]
SAYLRYFLPWNLYRLCRLLPGLDLPLAPGDGVLDLGSGPLTLAAALWISRPELRSLPLEFRCLDRSGAALEGGKKFFAALSGGSSPWTVKTVAGELRPRPGPLPAGLGGRAPALLAALYLYNEICQPLPPEDPGALSRLAETQAAFLAGLAGEGARILVLEPGVPRSGEFIGLLRASFLRLGCPPLSPCLHSGPCPLEKGEKPGRKRAAKWCHFAFDTHDAPRALRDLSAAAGIPKERATLSFLLVKKESGRRAATAAGPSAAAPCPVEAAPAAGARTAAGPASPARASLRILSDPFPLPAGEGETYGRYGCGEQGLVLVKGGRGKIERLQSGALARVKLAARRDPKSGALEGEAE